MNKSIKYLVLISLFAALASVIATFRFSLPFLPPFYKLDFSEVIVLLGGLYLGPIATIIIQIVKNFLKVIISGSNSGIIGDFANFIMGLSFCLPVSLFYKFNKKNKKNLVLSLTVGCISLILVGCIVNYYILLPFYADEATIIGLGQLINKNINSMFTFVLLATAPFNLIKGLASCVVTYIIFEKVNFKLIRK